MKLALISPNEQVYTGVWVENTTSPKPKYVWVPILIDNAQRVAEVVPEGSSFPIASPLYWKECADEVIADQWYLDASSDQIVPLPEPPPYPIAP